MGRLLELIQPCDFQLRSGVPTDRPGILRCRGCNSDVHDLSAMTSAEASQFLAQRRPDQCVRFSVDEHDRIQLADGPSGLVGRIARDARPMISVASLLLAACGGEAGTEGERADTTAATTIVAETASAPVPPPLPPPSVTQTVAPETSASATGSCVPMPSSSAAPRPVAGKPPAQPKIRELAGYY